MRLSLSLTNNMGLGGSRTQNLLTYTQKFDNAAWAKTSATISADATTAPDGSVTADKLVESTTTANQIAEQATTKAASATQYTVSVYAKPAGRDWISLLVYDGTNGHRVWFNVATGSASAPAAIGSGFTGVSASFEAVSNGFYRCKIVFTSTTSTSLRVRIGAATASAVQSYLGDGVSGVYLWGAQLETGGTATTYAAREA